MHLSLKKYILKAKKQERETLSNKNKAGPLSQKVSRRQRTWKMPWGMRVAKELQLGSLKKVYRKKV